MNLRPFLTGCNTVVVACYAWAGLTCGTVTAAAGIPAAAIACNSSKTTLSTQN
jgi:hypothetical protein